MNDQVLTNLKSILTANQYLRQSLISLVMMLQYQADKSLEIISILESESTTEKEGKEREEILETLSLIEGGDITGLKKLYDENDFLAEKILKIIQKNY